MVDLIGYYGEWSVQSNRLSFSFSIDLLQQAPLGKSTAFGPTASYQALIQYSRIQSSEATRTFILRVETVLPNDNEFWL